MNAKNSVLTMKQDRSFVEYSFASVVIIAMVFVVGCGKSESVISEQEATKFYKSDNITNLNCGAYTTVTTPLGSLQNNVWNSHSTDGFAWRQCLATRAINTTIEYGWYWRWPEDGSVVYAQPQVTLGQTPWVGHSQPYPGYPIPLKGLEKLVFDYDIEINASGKLNLVASLWMTTSPVIKKRADKASIAVEFKIWTYATPGFSANPAGQQLGEMTASGIRWEVWVEKNLRDTSGFNDNQWVFVAFRAKEPQLAIEYDAAEMIAYAIENNLFDKDLYIADIQLGTEVMSGEGETWLKQFSVSLEQNDNAQVSQSNP